MSAMKMMEMADVPIYANKTSENIDLYILCEGFKYTLREWRRWTHDEIVINDELVLTRGEYSMEFIEHITSILNNNGYVLKHKVDSITRRFMHYWLQLYNSNGRNQCLAVQQHNGSDLEYEEWDKTFPMEFWEDVTEEYIVYKGFDETPVGNELLHHIGDFFWNYLDVARSPKIFEKREEERRIEEEMRRWVEEPSDFGRTVFVAAAPITPKDKTDEVSDKEYYRNN